MTKYLIENKYGPIEIVNNEEQARNLVKGSYKTTYRKLKIGEVKRITKEINRNRKIQAEIEKNNSDKELESIVK